MPRILNIDPRVPTLHGALIPREAVDEHTRAYATVKEARAHARRIIKNAQLMATSIEQKALREGFQAGWLDSLNAIYNALAEKDQFYQQIENGLKQAFQHALELALQRPELELYLLEEWLNSGTRETKNLQIILPKHAEVQTEEIKRRFKEKLGVDPLVSFAETENVVIQSGEHVYEFSPQRAMSDLSNLAQCCFQRLEVKKASADWSADIVQHWLLNLQQRYGNANVDKYQFDDEFEDEFFDGFGDVSEREINSDGSV